MSELSYAELEKRICEIPDGPSKVLNTPRWAWSLNVVGALGVLVGLTPMILVKLMEPQLWMAGVAQAGLAVSIVAFAPGFARSIWVMVIGTIKWNKDMVEQLDHDFTEFRSLTRWLAGFPAEDLSERLRFVRAGRERLSAKVGVLAGRIKNLGILPILFALAVQFHAFGNWQEVPGWQLLLALFAIFMYLIALLGTLSSVRFQLYEMLLAESLTVISDRS